MANAYKNINEAEQSGDNSKHDDLVINQPVHGFVNDTGFENNTSAEPPHNAASWPIAHTSTLHYARKPSEAGLYLKTDVSSTPKVLDDTDRVIHRGSLDSDSEFHLLSPSYASLSLFPSARSSDNLAGSHSPVSSISSPALGALYDVTALPSPTTQNFSPELWRKLSSRSRNGSSASASRDEGMGMLPQSLMPISPPTKRKKSYSQLGSVAVAAQSHLNNHARTRSTSEYVPDPLQNFRPRNVTVPALVTPDTDAELGPANEHLMHREQYLPGHRKKQSMAAAKQSIPSPPPSNRSGADDEEGEEQQRNRLDLIGVSTGSEGAKKYWRPLRQLGRGAFSEVILATGQLSTFDDPMEGHHREELVALKIVTYDRSGDSDEARMDISVKREIEILQSISHPCLPRMLAFDDNETRALLVLNYCPGGDLFDLASEHKGLFKPTIIQRVFAELIAAVSYLHGLYIVHRDIKLENILFNIPFTKLARLDDPTSFPFPIVTLTDLGLSKRIPRPPQSPMLTHHCGSADYAAPELLMQQAYDGRATDMWALGVVLYSLLEGRLPFDQIPGQRRQASVKHRIARCDWMWCVYGDQYGDWIADKAPDLEAAREVTEGLLRKVGRGRWTLEKVESHEWVKNGIMIPGGLQTEDTMSGVRESVV